MPPTIPGLLRAMVRRRSHCCRWCAVLLVCTVLCACTSVVNGHGVPSGIRDAPNVPDPSASASISGPPAGSAPHSFAALEALVISSVPVGFVAQPDAVGDTGPSDLAKAARDDGQPDALQALRAEGFVRGYQRLWLDQTRD